MSHPSNVCPPVVAASPSTTSNINFDAIKQRQQATWASGDFAIVGTTLQIVGERLVEAIDVRAGENILDVAAGNGRSEERRVGKECA